MKEKIFKKIFKNRLFSLVLALAMVLSLMPGMKLTVQALEGYDDIQIDDETYLYEESWFSNHSSDVSLICDKHGAIAKKERAEEECFRIHIDTKDAFSDCRSARHIGKKCTVTFDMQGYGVAPEPQIMMRDGHVIQPIDPTAEGVVFGGWFMDKDCGNRYNFDSIVDQNITLYAKWLTPYTVTFDVQGHGTAPASQTVNEGNKATKPTDPTAAGFQFEGWYKEAACTNAWDFNSDTVTAATTLYAKWTGVSSTVGDYDLVVPTGVTELTPEQKAITPTKVTSTTTELDASENTWYVVDGVVGDAADPTMEITVNGDVNLILPDGMDAGNPANQLNVKKITISRRTLNGSLTIWGQANNQGTLAVNNSKNNTIEELTEVIINGGTVKCTSISYGIDINGELIINGGNVEATGKDVALHGNPVNITGGTVTAIGIDYHGLYSFSDNIAITGGEVIATGGLQAISADAGTITIDPKAEIKAGDDSTGTDTTYTNQKYVHITFPHKHTLCGGDGCAVPDHGTDNHGDKTVFEEWTSTDSLPTDPGNYYLTGDVELTEAWTVSNDVTLCLNGHVIKQTETNKNVITVSSEKTLTLCDCGTTEHTFKENSKGLWVLNGAEGTSHTVKGGVITGGTGTVSKNGGVLVNSKGTFTMYGGSIVGNTADYGGGVYDYGTFTMYGGSIVGNTANYSGGGVYVDAGTFTMTGGDITKNTAAASGGGGVSVNNSGTFTMTGGDIVGNTTEEEGGGVYVAGGGSVTMSGGEITGNSAECSGGVEVGYNGTFTMSGGKITGNSATKFDGGGVRVCDNGAFTMSGGEITENTATDLGGGVYVSGTFIVGGSAKVSGNKQAGDPATDNNVYLPEGKAITLGTGSNGAPVPVTTGDNKMEIHVTTAKYDEESKEVVFNSDGDEIVASGVVSGQESCFICDDRSKNYVFNNGKLEVASEPLFDLRDGNGARSASAITGFSYTAPVWKIDESNNKPYTFAGWSEDIDGTTFVSKGSDETYDATDFKMGRTYYAVWKNTFEHIVVTQDVTVNDSGLFFDGKKVVANDPSEAQYHMAASDVKEQYGLELTADESLKLSMNNTTIDMQAYPNDAYPSLGINNDCELDVTGINNVIVFGSSNNLVAAFYLDTDKILTVTGSGTLNFDSSRATTNLSNYGAYIRGAFTLEKDVTVNAESGVSNGYSYGILFNSNAKINGIVNAKSGTSTVDGKNSYGILFNSDATINGIVNANGGKATHAHGVFCVGKLTIDEGGTVTGIGGTGTVGAATNADGVVAKGALVVVNGTLNATGGKATGIYHGLQARDNVTVGTNGKLNLRACPADGANKGAMIMTVGEKTFAVAGTVTADGTVAAQTLKLAEGGSISSTASIAGTITIDASGSYSVPVTVSGAKDSKDGTYNATQTSGTYEAATTGTPVKLSAGPEVTVTVTPTEDSSAIKTLEAAIDAANANSGKKYDIVLNRTPATFEEKDLPGNVKITQADPALTIEGSEGAKINVSSTGKIELNLPDENASVKVNGVTYKGGEGTLYIDPDGKITADDFVTAEVEKTDLPYTLLRNVSTTVGDYTYTAYVVAPKEVQLLPNPTGGEPIIVQPEDTTLYIEDGTEPLGWTYMTVDDPSDVTNTVYTVDGGQDKVKFVSTDVYTNTPDTSGFAFGTSSRTVDGVTYEGTSFRVYYVAADVNAVAFEGYASVGASVTAKFNKAGSVALGTDTYTANKDAEIVITKTVDGQTVSAGTRTTIAPVSGEANKYTATYTAPSNPSGGGSSGGSSSAPTVTVPVSGDEHSVNVSATVSGSTATVNIKDADIEKITHADAETGVVEIDLSGLKQDVNTAKIPTKTVEKIAEAIAEHGNDTEGVSVKLSTATVTFDGTATRAISEQAKGNTIEIKVDEADKKNLTAEQKSSIEGLGSQIIVEATVVSNGQKISDFKGGSAEVSIPYTLKNAQKANGLVVFFVADDGSVEKVPATYVDGNVVFTVKHFSHYVVAYSAVNAFTDVAEGAYYYDAVKWAVENGITDGTSDTTFSPNGITTRAQVVTFLWRAAGCPEPKAMSSFSDVAAGSYYEKAVAWAVANGITKGTSATTFSPNAKCTRGQIVTFLYRFNGVDTMNIKDNPFSDVPAGKFYYDAVLWAAENGITSGTTATTFSPVGSCTRGQTVTFLYRLLNK